MGKTHGFPGGLAAPGVALSSVCAISITIRDQFSKMLSS